MLYIFRKASPLHLTGKACFLLSAPNPLILIHQFILLLRANPITFRVVCRCGVNTKPGQFPDQIMRPVVLFVGVQYMAVISRQFDDPLIFKNKESIVEKDIFLLLIEIAVLVNACYIIMEPLMDIIKCFGTIQFTDKAYCRYLIKWTV